MVADPVVVAKVTEVIGPDGAVAPEIDEQLCALIGRFPPVADR